jgi:hypothetical protein
LLDGLEQSNFQEAVENLNVQSTTSRYTHQQLMLSIVLLSALGVDRLSHVNDQPVKSWGVLLEQNRRPDGDTLDQYFNLIIKQDEEKSATTLMERQGQICNGGIIDKAHQESLKNWMEAGLNNGDIWYFDDHVIEYTGKARIGKTKHGTKNNSVKAITRYTVQNGLCSLSYYFPSSISYAEAMQYVVGKANECLPDKHRIRILSYDRAGWDAKLFRWLEDEQDITPITWVKRTAPNVRLLDEVNDDKFQPIEQERTVGKDGKHKVVRIADTTVDFPKLDSRRVVIMETESKKRIGIYTTAPRPKKYPVSSQKETTVIEGTPLILSTSDKKALSTYEVIDGIRYKQRIENQFKVEVNEIGSDNIPTNQTYKTTVAEPYNVPEAKKKLENAKKRLNNYNKESKKQERLREEGQLNTHEFNVLNKRTQRLRKKAEKEIEKRRQEIDTVKYSETGETTHSVEIEVLDTRKFALFNLFKLHALVALKLLARRLGMSEAGPERLRRAFLSFGDRVEFDHVQRTAFVYAHRFSRMPMQQGYEELCTDLNNSGIRLMRNGINYHIRFCCQTAIQEHGNNTPCAVTS